MGNVSEGRNCPHTNKTHFHNKIALSLVLELGNLLTNSLFLLNYYDEMFSMPRKKNL